MNFEPIRPISLVELIVHRFEELMLNGDLSPETRLPAERELAQRLQVSRTSLRQAMAILKARGLISIRAGSGSFANGGPDEVLVTPLAGTLSSFKERILEPMEVRQLLEPQVARLAAERATEENVWILERIAAAQKALMNNERSFVAEDIAFHRHIAVMANNGVLLRLIDDSQLMLRDSREISLSTKKGAQVSWKGHLAVLQAIKNRDSNRAYEAMAAHITMVSNLIRSHMTEDAELLDDGEKDHS